MHFSLFVLAFSLSVVATRQDAGCGKSGIRGQVYQVSGNQMPSPDDPPAPPKGVQTTLYIYELTNIGQVSRQGQSAFYASIGTKLVREVATKADGSYLVKLKPGWYSLFVKKDSLFFSSQFDSNNNIHPVEVREGVMTEDEFRVNYNAVY